MFFFFLGGGGGGVIRGTRKITKNITNYNMSKIYKRFTIFPVQKFQSTHVHNFTFLFSQALKKKKQFRMQIKDIHSSDHIQIQFFFFQVKVFFFKFKSRFFFFFLVQVKVFFFFKFKSLFGCHFCNRQSAAPVAQSVSERYL